jgi:hypothetical protein
MSAYCGDAVYLPGPTHDWHGCLLAPGHDGNHACSQCDLVWSAGERP